MKERWESNKVRTSEDIFAEINEKMAQPVGIILFGADCDLKDSIYMRCVERVRNLATGYGGKGSMPLRAAKKALFEWKNVLTVMHGDASGDREQRCQVVMALREIGAKTVVGIYAKCNPLWLGDRATTDRDALNEQAWKLLNNPPVADDFDELLTVCEENEKPRVHNSTCRQSVVYEEEEG